MVLLREIVKLKQDKSSCGGSLLIDGYKMNVVQLEYPNLSPAGLD